MDIPLCECGCGRPVQIATKTRSERGWIKGQPLRFHSQHCAARVNGRLGGQAGGEKHPSWKGDNVGYRALHEWVEKNKEKLGKCGRCETVGKTVWANLSGNYERKFDDWAELCYSCHIKFDNQRRTDQLLKVAKLI